MVEPKENFQKSKKGKEKRKKKRKKKEFHYGMSTF